MIVPTDQVASNTVSKRTTKTGVKPVIDIRNKQALSVFEQVDYLQVEISEDQIIVTGYDEVIHSSERNTAKQKDKVLSRTANLINITSILELKKKCEVRFSKEDMENVVGQEYRHIPISYFECNSEFADASDVQNILQQAKIPLQVISLFSGAGVMDMGFIEEGFDIRFALELNKEAVMSYQTNIGNHIMHGDITQIDKSLFAEIGSPVMIAGSPCQGISPANRHTNFLDNSNNALIKHYIESIKANPNCKVFVLENVPQLLTAGDGRFKEEILHQLSDFEHTVGVLSAADFGEAQERKRSFIFGSKLGKIEMPQATHQKGNYVSISQAFEGLHEGVVNQKDYSIPKNDTLERMKFVPQGGNWRDIPKHLLTKAFKTGNTHSSIFKRLEWDKPAITIANARKSNILHPTENRILSVRECARLFGLKDDFTFRGSLSSMQQQICNAVPVKLSKAIAQTIKNTIMKYNIRNKNDRFGLI